VTKIYGLIEYFPKNNLVIFNYMSSYLLSKHNHQNKKISVIIFELQSHGDFTTFTRFSALYNCCCTKVGLVLLWQTTSTVVIGNCTCEQCVLHSVNYSKLSLN